MNKNVNGIDILSFPFRYAVREGSSKVKIFKNFKEKKSFKPELGAEGKYEVVPSIITLIIRYIWRSFTWSQSQ